MAKEDLKIKEIPLNGRLITAKDSTLISKSDSSGNKYIGNFSVLKNLRYNDWGIEGIKGMTKINSASFADSEVLNGFFYDKSFEFKSEQFTYVQATNAGSNYLFHSTVGPPNTDTFSSIHTDASGAGTGYFSLAPQNQMVYCNNKESLIYGGTEMFLSAFWQDSSSSNDWEQEDTEYANDTDTAHTIALQADGTDNKVRLRISTVRPVKSFKFYVGTANTATSTIYKISVWTDTGWQDFTGYTDGTSSGGKTMAQTGVVSFDDTQHTAQQRYKFGTVGYWYKVNIDAISGSPTIYHVATEAKLQPLTDVWDGTYEPLVKCLQYNGSALNTYLEYDVAKAAEIDETTISFDQFDTGEYLLFGFLSPLCGIQFNFLRGYVNTVAATMTVQYWNGTAWTNVNNLFDHTRESTSFKKSGVVYWSPPDPGLEKPRTIEDDTIVYYYRFGWSFVSPLWLNNAVQLDFVGGIRAPKEISHYKFSVYAQNRVFLCNKENGKKNSVLVSANNSATIYNGDDSTEITIGTEDELMAGAGMYTRTTAAEYDQVVLCKKNSTYLISGTSPSDWKVHQVSNDIGCVAPGTMVSANISNKSGSSNMALWQGANGIYAFDGSSLIPLHYDIEDVFDSINTSLIGSSTAFYDEKKQEYHWCFAKGSSIDTEMVLDLRRMKWFEISRGSTPITMGFTTVDSDGNNYVYAGGTTGDIYRLENTGQFVSSNIVFTYTTGDINLSGSLAIESNLRYLRFISTALTSGSATATVYSDTSSTGTVFMYSQTGSNRIVNVFHGQNTSPKTYHKINMTMTTGEQFTPLALIAGYKPLRVDKN